MHPVVPPDSGPAQGRRARRWRQGVLGALSSPTFRMYWSGAFVSSVGSWLQLTAVLWLAGNIGSDTLVGFVNLVGWIPCLFLGLFAGAMSDRMDRRRVILACQVVMMLCSILIGLCIHFTWINDLVLMVFLGISGVAYAIFTPAWVSAIPFLVQPGQILSANTLNNAQFNFARFIGPIAGGLLLVSTTDSIPFYLNALTYAAFIVLILVSKAELPPRQAGKGHVFSDVADGFRYVRRNPWIARVLAGICGLSFFGFSFIVLIPSVSKQLLGVKGHSYGVLMGMTGLGALVGLVAVAALTRRLSLKAMMFAGALLTAGCLVSFALSRCFWVSCLLAMGVGAGFLINNAAAVAALQGNVGPEMEGRVTSMSVVAYVGIFPLGGLLLGYLSDALSLEVTLLIAGGACLLVALFVAFFVSVPGRGRPRKVEGHELSRSDTDTLT